eukprot:CFRG4865T1
MDRLSQLTDREKAVKAVIINNKELLEALLRDGVDPFHRPIGYPQSDSATLTAAELGRADFLRIFCSIKREQSQTQMTDPVVFLASCVGLSVTSIDTLCTDIGANPNQVLPPGYRPLHAVLRCGITRCDAAFRALMGHFKRREIYRREDPVARTVNRIVQPSAPGPSRISLFQSNRGDILSGIRMDQDTLYRENLITQIERTLAANQRTISHLDNHLLNTGAEISNVDMLANVNVNTRNERVQINRQSDTNVSAHTDNILVRTAQRDVDRAVDDINILPDRLAITDNMRDTRRSLLNTTQTSTVEEIDASNRESGRVQSQIQRVLNGRGALNQNRVRTNDASEGLTSDDSHVQVIGGSGLFGAVGTTEGYGEEMTHVEDVNTRTHSPIPLLTRCQFNCHFGRICGCNRMDTNIRAVNNGNRGGRRNNNNRGCRHRQPYATETLWTVNSTTTPTRPPSERRLQCLKRLVELGAKPNMPDTNRCTPLHYSVWCGMAAESLYLLQVAPQTLTMSDNRGNSPLHYAAFTANEEIICLLLKNGAPINSTNVWGETPLHMAVIACNIQALRLLIRWGANVTLRMVDGKTPSDLAEANGFVEGATVLNAVSRVPELKCLSMQMATKRWTQYQVQYMRQMKEATAICPNIEGEEVEEAVVQLLTVEGVDMRDSFGFGVECCGCCVEGEGTA